MTNMIKNLSFGGILALVAMMILTVSWKNRAHNVEEATWYEVTITNSEEPNDPEHQQIGRVYPGGIPSGSCNTLPGLTCAVLLDGELDPNQLPMTVADAESLGFDVTDQRQKQN